MLFSSTYLTTIKPVFSDDFYAILVFGIGEKNKQTQNLNVLKNIFPYV